MATFDQVTSSHPSEAWDRTPNGGGWDGSAVAEVDPGTLVGAETWPIDDTYDPASWEFNRPTTPEGWSVESSGAVSRDRGVLGEGSDEYGDLEYRVPMMPSKGHGACCGSCAGGGVCGKDNGSDAGNSWWRGNESRMRGPRPNHWEIHSISVVDTLAGGGAGGSNNKLWNILHGIVAKIIGEDPCPCMAEYFGAQKCIDNELGKDGKPEKTCSKEISAYEECKRLKKAEGKCPELVFHLNRTTKRRFPPGSEEAHGVIHCQLHCLATALLVSGKVSSVVGILFELVEKAVMPQLPASEIRDDILLYNPAGVVCGKIVDSQLPAPRWIPFAPRWYPFALRARAAQRQCRLCCQAAVSLIASGS